MEQMNPNMTTPSDVPNPPPALWNPNAAACWSLVFSPAFGAFLHARNAEALGRTDEAKANRIVFYITLAFFGIILISLFVPTIPEGLWRIAGLGLLLGWYYGVGKKQADYVKVNLQNNYQRKPWTKPLLIGVAGLAAYFGMAVILIIVESLLLGVD